MSGNLLKRHLQGYQVKSVPIRELPEAIKTYLPQAVIVNEIALSTPVDDETAQILQTVGANVPIICCPLPEPGHLGRMMGVDHYLVKPISRERLLRVLDGYGDNVQRILIVDDDIQLVELMARFVKAASRPYTVDVACGGEEGLARMQAFQPDLVILDLIMPSMDGLTILKFMKADGQLRNIPVVMITARDLPQPKIQFPGQKEISIQGLESFTLTDILNSLQAILDTLPMPKFATVSAPKAEEIQLHRPVSSDKI